MAELTHAPYAGATPPMAIGLKALDLAEWIEPDEHLAAVRGEIDKPQEPPLECASRLVQEDLVLMARHDSGWQLAAASLCFPSTWVLAEKFGRDMDGIHKPVPGYAEHIG